LFAHPEAEEGEQVPLMGTFFFAAFAKQLKEKEIAVRCWLCLFTAHQLQQQF
jgi:hypothetical protein